MASGSFNIALGREVELYNRVDTDDPANSALIVMVLANAGLESDALLRDYDTFSALLAGASNEVTNTGYARKTLTQADLTAFVVDDTLDRIVLQLPTQTWTTIGVGDLWRKCVVGYDPDTTAGTDTTVVPVKFFDILNAQGTALVPNGDDILGAWPDGFHISS
jgi:hypothetical protein